MRFMNALTQAQWHIKTLWRILAIAVILNVLTLFGWMHAQTKIKIHVPPRIPASGLTLQQGDVPKTTIYSFAYYIWQSLNHWPNNGMQDYKTRIESFSPYLTPKFKLKLIKNYNQLLNQGELQYRIRLMQGMADTGFQVNNVKQIDSNTWIVHLAMHLTEMMNTNAKVVKDVELYDTLKIVKYDVDAKANPWGLAISDFAESSKRIKTRV